MDRIGDGWGQWMEGLDVSQRRARFWKLAIIAVVVLVIWLRSGSFG